MNTASMNSTALLFIIYLLAMAGGYWLRSLNLNHLKQHGTEVPPGFDESINKEILAKTTAYALEKSRLGLMESVVNNVILILFLFGGLINLYDQWIASLSPSFLVSGLLFFIILALAQTMIEAPFSFYSTFSIENRYGFNTTTKRLWLSDLGKSTIISLIIMSLLVAESLG